MSEKATLERMREKWRERGRMDKRLGKKPHDEDTLRAVGGELAVRAYMEAYETTRKR
jgi:hypothetical protein